MKKREGPGKPFDNYTLSSIIQSKITSLLLGFLLTLLIFWAIFS